MAQDNEPRPKDQPPSSDRGTPTNYPESAGWGQGLVTPEMQRQNPVWRFLEDTYPRQIVETGLSEYTIDDEAAISLAPTDPKVLKIDSLRALKKNTGAGTRALDLLSRQADKHGVWLEGLLHKFEKEGLSKDDLLKFYQKAGWELRYPDKVQRDLSEGRALEDIRVEMVREPRIKGQGGEIRPAVKAALKVDELVEQFKNVDVPDGVLETGSAEEINQKFDDAYLVGEARNRLDLINDQLEDIDQDSHPVDFKIFSRDQRQLINFIKRFEGSTLEQAAPQDQPNLPALLGPPEEPRPKGKLRRGIGSLRRAPWFALAQMAWGSFSPEQRKAAEDWAIQAYGSLEAAYDAVQAWTGRRDFPAGIEGGIGWAMSLLGDQKPSGIITLPEKMYRDFYHGTPNEWSSEEGYPVGRPRLDFMSTGEGTQMYAPGFYGGEARAVGYEYADRLAQEHGTVPNVYKGEIREDLLNNKFIDFNLPVNEQSQDVQEVFEKLGYGTKTPDRFAGADILLRMTRRMGKDAAIDTLREEGIVGLRYLDKFSRDNKNLYKGKSLVKMDGKALFLNEDWQLQGRQVLRYLIDNNMDMGEFIREQREFYGQKGRISRALGGARQQEKFLDILERTVVKKSPLTRNMVIWDQPLLDQIGRTIKKEMAAGGFIDKPLYDNLIAPSRGSFIDKPLYEGAY